MQTTKPPRLMKSKICLVTGATSGVGLFTAIGLSQLGADVVLVGRRPERVRAAAELIEATTGHAPHSLWTADLSILREVRGLADTLRSRIPRLDVLVNNAGGIYLRREETVDKLEHTFALNHLSCFLLTHLLLEPLLAGAPSRIVNVASNAHWSARIRWEDLQLQRGYNPWRAYANSKLGNVWFTYELARRWEGRGVTANTLTPGLVATNLGKQNAWIRPLLSVWYRLFGKTPARGAETPIYLASSPEVSRVSGRFFVDRLPVRSSPVSYDSGLAQRMWEISADLAGIA